MRTIPSHFLQEMVHSHEGPLIFSTSFCFFLGLEVTNLAKGASALPFAHARLSPMSFANTVGHVETGKTISCMMDLQGDGVVEHEDATRRNNEDKLKSL